MSRIEGNKYWLYGLILLCLGAGMFFKLYDLSIGPLGYAPFLAAGVLGLIGVLLRFAWEIRTSWYGVLSVLLCFELLGVVLHHIGFQDLAQVSVNLSGLMYPLAGILFLGKAYRLRQEDRPLSLKFMVLAILNLLATLAVYAVYVRTFFLLGQAENLQRLGNRVVFLGIFAMLLLIDFTEKLKGKGLETEQILVRGGMLVIAVKYFKDYIFV